MGIQDMPERADPHAVGNVGAMLVTHLMVHLMRKGVLGPQDVRAIFQETRGRYTSIPVGPIPADDWDKQTNAILTLLEGDVSNFASQPTL
jgi:hypothetical protein